MPGDKRTPARQDKKTSYGASQKRTDTGQGGGGDKIEMLLAEARERTEAGKYGRAFASLKQILASDPNHQEALRLSATVHLRLGSLVAARAAFDSLVRKAMEQQDHQSAESLLREYLEAGARYVPFIEWLGQVLEGQGNSEAAVTEYGRAIDIIIEDQDPEQKPKADALYQKIQQLAPHSPEVGRLQKVLDPSASQASTIASAGGQETAVSPAADLSGGVQPAPSPPAQATETPAQNQEQATASSAEQVGDGTSSSRFPWDPGGASASSAPSGIGLGAAQPSAKPWEEQSTPAPFPWEVEAPPADIPPPPGASTAPPISTDFITAPSPEAPPSLAEASTPAFEEPPSALPEVEVAAPVQQEVVQEEVPPAAEEPVPTVLASEDTAIIEPTPEPVAPSFLGTQEPAELESPLSTYQEQPSTFSEPAEPTSEPVATDSKTGFRFATDPTSESVIQDAGEDSGSVDVAPTWGTQQEEYVPPPAPSESFEQPAFSDSSSGELAEAFAEDIAEQAEPVVEEKKAGTKTRRKSRSTSPTWAVPASPGGAADAKSRVSFFPTAARVHYQLAILTRRVTSTVRSIVMLCVGLTVGTAVLGVLGAVVLSLTWIGVNEEPSTAFHNLTSVPAQGSLNARTNGYVALRGLGITSSRAPVQVGQGRIVAGYEEGGRSEWPQGFTEAARVLSGWYAGWDPAAEFRKQGGLIRSWSKALRRPLLQYRRFVGKPIEDLGFGSVEGPDEAYVLGLHRLYLAEGFAAGLRRGVNRLERDLETWRRALAKAKTLRLKMLAAEALNDNLTVASGLLSRAGLSKVLVPILAKMSRPLNHAERSLRWPMQNQFVLEMNMMQEHVKSSGPASQTLYVKVLTYFPLPEQKSLNAHAEYFEALAKHDSVLKVDGDPRRGMPELYRFAHTPPQTLSDYFKNPVDNILVQESRVDWQDAIGRILETEARLRLATLQARLRGQSLVRNPVLLIARAGQDFYDPFTGFPMLFNPTKTVLYSVGKDGSDNDGDLANDLSVPLFVRKI